MSIYKEMYIATRTENIIDKNGQLSLAKSTNDHFKQTISRSDLLHDVIHKYFY
jgi:hypothetical protein